MLFRSLRDGECDPSGPHVERPGLESVRVIRTVLGPFVGPGVQEVLPFQFHGLVHGESEKLRQKVGSKLYLFSEFSMFGPLFDLW